MHLHLDFDAFYCGVEQNLNPSLRDRPFIIAQKNCAATTSYAARALGIKKLTRVSDVKKQYPQVLIVNGEDLTRYKAEGQRIFEYLRDEILPGCQVERIGMEEVRINLDPIVARNVSKLAKLGISSMNDLQTIVEDVDCESLVGEGFLLSLTCDDTSSFGCPEFFFRHAGGIPEDYTISTVPLYIASHLANYIKERLFMEHHYSISIGCAANPIIAKMISGESKPFGLTVLEQDDFQSYLDKLHIRKVPGYGSKIVRMVEDVMKDQYQYDDLTVKTIRHNLPLKGCPQSFYGIFSPNLGQRLWNLIHALPTEPENSADRAKEYPQSISVEDTHANLLKHPISQVLQLLVERLIQQLTDALYDSDNFTWKALPHTLRLSIRQAGDLYPQKRSKSVAFPGLPIDVKTVVHQLEPLFKQLYRHKRPIHMINIAVTGIKDLEEII